MPLCGRCTTRFVAWGVVVDEDGDLDVMRPGWEPPRRAGACCGPAQKRVRVAELCCTPLTPIDGVGLQVREDCRADQRKTTHTP